MRLNFKYQPANGRTGTAPIGAVSYLSGAGPMAALMPAVTRMAALQKDCATALPAMFSQCDILQFEAGQLVLATPNAALAAKLKQQLPKLQADLSARGWKVDAIKLKVQVTRSLAPIVHTHALVLPHKAMQALSELGDALDASSANSPLAAALRLLVRHHKEE
ncbi:MAG: hypothetical protein ACI83P_002135 [Janthinobacterium sp.]|jgi:hypothetical protein